MNKRALATLTVASMISLSSVNALAMDAGCGFGSLIFTKSTKLVQLLAMTTNQSTLTQPLGITSGTSNCSASGIVMNDKEIQYFVEVNQEELSRQMAQGHGDKLATLASLKGCADTSAQQAFAGFTQSSYAKIIPAANTSASDMVNNLNHEMSSQADLHQLCHGS